MDKQALYYLTRNIQWRYRLDQWEDAQLKRLLAAHDKAARKAVAALEKVVAGESTFATERARALLVQLSTMTASVKVQLGQAVAEVAISAAGACLQEHTDIVGIGGLVPGFNAVALAPAQLRSLIVDTPVGGRNLQGWVDRAYDAATQERIKAEVEAGVLAGEGYGPLINRVADGLNAARHEVTTLTRTYVQNVNVSAQEAVYRANPDVVGGVKWCATLETASKGGFGTCIVCAALDGKEWLYSEEATRPHPPCPKHPRCRCLLLPRAKSWRELGIPIDDFEAAVRPYTQRGPGNIDAGGKRLIEEVGFDGGDYATWFAKQAPARQANVLGPTRFELYRNRQYALDEFITTRGDLIPIKALKSGVKGGV